jgi:hypothetical protein
VKFCALVALLFGCWLLMPARSEGPPLSGTQPLNLDGDLSAQMVEGIDRWLDRETLAVAEARKAKWPSATAENWNQSIDKKRELLRKMIGATERRNVDVIQVVTDAARPNARANYSYSVERIRWRVFDGVHGEGLLLLPHVLAKAAVDCPHPMRIKRRSNSQELRRDWRRRRSLPGAWRNRGAGHCHGRARSLRPLVRIEKARPIHQSTTPGVDLPAGI